MQLASQFKQNAAYGTHYLALAESFGCERVDRRRKVVPGGKPKHRQRALDKRFPCALNKGKAVLSLDISLSFQTVLREGA